MQYQLDARQQAVTPIAALTVAGRMEKLDVALNAELNAGLTLSEVKEILLQLYAYYGFSRGLNGLSCFVSMMKSRGGKGLSDDEDRTATSPSADWNSVQAGSLAQTQLIGQPVGGPLFDFAPVIGVWSKTRLFGDIFQ